MFVFCVIYYEDHQRARISRINAFLNFVLQKSYWCGSSIEAQDITLVGAERTAVNAEYIEEEPIGLKAGVQIKGLTKEYHKGKFAVNQIHLNMYESQITALLGHNGAGKSTTMSMLTGLFPPSSGTALVNGYDIRTDIQGISLYLSRTRIVFNEIEFEIDRSARQFGPVSAIRRALR